MDNRGLLELIIANIALGLAVVVAVAIVAVGTLWELAARVRRRRSAFTDGLTDGPRLSGFQRC